MLGNLNISNNKFKNSKFSEIRFFGSTIILELPGVCLMTKTNVLESSLSSKVYILFESYNSEVISNYLNSEF